MGFSQKIYFEFWLKPVAFIKYCPHAKASGNSFKAVILQKLILEKLCD